MVNNPMGSTEYETNYLLKIAGPKLRFAYSIVGDCCTTRKTRCRDMVLLYNFSLLLLTSKYSNMTLGDTRVRDLQWVGAKIVNEPGIDMGKFRRFESGAILMRALSKLHACYLLAQIRAECPVSMPLAWTRDAR